MQEEKGGLVWKERHLLPGDICGQFKFVERLEVMGQLGNWHNNKVKLGWGVGRVNIGGYLGQEKDCVMTNL